MKLGFRVKFSNAVREVISKGVDMAKIIELFNHKGGVSKTTTTFHLAWKLSQQNKKVLLVDGDPQCNLTGIFLGEEFDEYYENNATKQMKRRLRQLIVLRI